MTVTSQDLQMRSISDNIPYIKEDLGIGKLVNFYHNSYFHINISNLVISVQTALRNCYFLSLKINSKNHNYYLLKHLENKVENIQNKLALIKQSRQKRAIFNGLGTAIKYITGNLDQNDLNDIMTNMNKLKQNEDSLNLQNTQTLSILSKLEEKFDSNSLIISENFKTINNQLKNLTTEINIQEASLLEIFTVNSLEQFLSNILNTRPTGMEKSHFMVNNHVNYYCNKTHINVL